MSDPADDVELAAGLQAARREMATRGMKGAAPLPGLTPRAARAVANLLGQAELRVLERLRAAEAPAADDTRQLPTIAVSGDWRAIE